MTDSSTPKEIEAVLGAMYADNTASSLSRAKAIIAALDAVRKRQSPDMGNPISPTPSASAHPSRSPQETARELFDLFHMLGGTGVAEAETFLIRSTAAAIQHERDAAEKQFKEYVERSTDDAIERERAADAAGYERRKREEDDWIEKYAHSAGYDRNEVAMMQNIREIRRAAEAACDKRMSQLKHENRRLKLAQEQAMLRLQQTLAAVLDKRAQLPSAEALGSAVALLKGAT